MNLELEAQIESILFFKAEPVSFKELQKILGSDEFSIETALKNLEGSLTNRGLRLVFNENNVLLGTHPEMASKIEELKREYLNKDIGKAGLEALTIILYLSPISRSDIDYIRGINSNFILRNLLVRGLVERVSSGEDRRVFLYKPTIGLLSFLGVSRIEDLPDYEKIRNEIEEFKKENENNLGEDNRR
jgi:segregation and condensation protein B